MNLLFCYLCLLYCLFCFLQTCGHADLLALFLYDGLLCFCHFPIRRPGSGVVLDCIDSWSLPSSFQLLAFRRADKSRI